MNQLPAISDRGAKAPRGCLVAAGPTTHIQRVTRVTPMMRRPLNSDPKNADLHSPAQRDASLPVLGIRDSLGQSAQRILSMREARLSKHADYQRVYKASRKYFSPSMTYFFRVREGESSEGLAGATVAGPRVGLTAGRVMGKAVDRNRIKRRMREAVRLHLDLIESNVDVVLHPRRSVMTMDFAKLEAEVARVFTTIRKSLGGEHKAGEGNSGAATNAASGAEAQ